MHATANFNERRTASLSVRCASRMVASSAALSPAACKARRASTVATIVEIFRAQAISLRARHGARRAKKPAVGARARAHKGAQAAAAAAAAPSHGVARGTWRECTRGAPRAREPGGCAVGGRASSSVRSPSRRMEAISANAPRRRSIVAIILYAVVAELAELAAG